MITNEYGLAERQTALLSMIREIDRLLRENGIAYSLCGGSLLGAVRHGGFIPWDDDMDIMLDRANYEKLIALFRRGEVETPYTLRRQLWLYRIQQKADADSKDFVPSVDVFVMDHCPDNGFKRRFKVLLIRFLQGMLHEEVSYSGHSLWQKICLFVSFWFGKLFTYNFKFRLYDKVCRMGNKKPSRTVTGYTDLFKLISVRYDASLLEKIERRAFEDTELPVTAAYDHYLTTQYGDYMTPPKSEDRVPTHI